MLYKALTILTFVCIQNQYLVAQNSKLHPRLEVSFNKNVELLGLSYFLAYEGIGMDEDTIEVDGVDILRSEFHAYGNLIYNNYRTYQTSENLANALLVAEHLWLDYIISILLQVDPFPNASIPEDMPVSKYLRFSKENDPREAKNNLTTFLSSMNAFYIEANFDRYLQESKHYYDSALKEILSNLPDAEFIDHMEEYFDYSFDMYWLIPSLTLPKTMGFGPRLDNQAFNVFGAVGPQQVHDTSELHMGFENANDIRELSVHEFGHSFVNPVLDRLPETMIDSSESLHTSVKEAMYSQGYNNWNGCVYEHFVRTVEIIIAESTLPQAEYRKLENSYLVDRRFIFIPQLKPILSAYQDRRLTFEQAVYQGLERLIALSKN